MNFQDLINLKTRNLTFILISAIICLCLGLIVGHNKNQSRFEESIFLTFSVEDENKTSSTYENLQASDQITESIQGWFKDPALAPNLEKKTGQLKSINAKKQEKNNLIISFDSLTEEEGLAYQNALIENLQEKLNSYNQKSDLKINIANQYSVITNKLNLTIIFGLIGLILGGLFGTVWSFYLEKLHQQIQSFDQLSKYSRVFQFSTPEKMKKNFQFISAYLNNKYSGEKVQLFDLTKKSKIALDTIAKNTKIKEIKSYNYPERLSESEQKMNTILLVQFGHSKIEWLDEIDSLGIQNIDVITFNQV